ncbi:MAG TPA: hypothetical protein VGC99_28135 [Candidatus Tectomicrobia bacterium]
MTHPNNLTYAVNDIPPLAKLIFLRLQQVMVLSIYLVMMAIVVHAAGVLRRLFAPLPRRCRDAAVSDCQTGGWAAHHRSDHHLSVVAMT